MPKTNTPLGAPTVTAEVPPQAGDAVSDSTPPAVSVEQPEQTSEDKITRHEPAQPVMAPAKEPLPERTPTPQPQVVASVPEPLETEAVVETTVAPTPVPVSAGYTAPPAGSVFLVQLDSFSIKGQTPSKRPGTIKTGDTRRSSFCCTTTTTRPGYVFVLGALPKPQTRPRRPQETIGKRSGIRRCSTKWTPIFCTAE